MYNILHIIIVCFRFAFSSEFAIYSNSWIWFSWTLFLEHVVVCLLEYINIIKYHARQNNITIIPTCNIRKVLGSWWIIILGLKCSTFLIIKHFIRRGNVQYNTVKCLSSLIELLISNIVWWGIKLNAFHNV